jgi:glycosyltransferase involved in cell wall biosynthesis
MEVSMSPAAPSMSVVIAVYKRPDLLLRIFTSLVRQTFGNFVVVLADDGSGPDVAALLDEWQSKLPHGIQHAWHEDDGFRKVVIVNQAVLRARGAYLVFIDGDCILHRRFLERHWLRRQKRQALSGRRIMMDETLTQRVTLQDIRSGAFERIGYWWNHCSPNDRRNGFYLPWLFPLRNLWRRRYPILGSNFSLHREDFMRVGGYDQRIIGRGLEDDNLCARLTNSGVAIRTVAQEAVQFHCYHTSDPIPHSPEVIRRFRDCSESFTEYGIAPAEIAPSEDG